MLKLKIWNLLYPKIENLGETFGIRSTGYKNQMGLIMVSKSSDPNIKLISVLNSVTDLYD